jgi:hypothetical protein
MTARASGCKNWREVSGSSELCSTIAAMAARSRSKARSSARPRSWLREGGSRERERARAGAPRDKNKAREQRGAAAAPRSEDGDARKSQGLQLRQQRDHVAMKARWAAGDNGACHSDSTRSNGPSLALHALKAVVGQPRNQAAAENDT